MTSMKQVLCPINKDNNCPNASQEINSINYFPHKNIEYKDEYNKKVSGKYKNDFEDNKENINLNIPKKIEEKKMEIEGEQNSSNELIASNATNYSNNTRSSIESNNLNKNPKILIYPEQNINQNNQNENENQTNAKDQIIPNNQNPLPNNNIKKLFDYNFESSDEFISFAGEYLNEIYTNLLLDEKEIKYKPNIGYMNAQNDINEQMRAILIDWLIEVHYRFRLKSETLFQTVWIIDTYLTYRQIARAKLQLLGIASLLISCKSQEIYYPPLKEFIDITDGAYVKNELLEMENNVLKVLNFNIVSPTSNDFYNIIAKAFNFDKKQFYLGKYFLESALIDYNMIKYSSSVIAVSCAYIVMKYFGIHNYKILYSQDVIKENCPQKTIKDAAKEIYILVHNLSQSTLKAVKGKYSLSQFYCIAQSFEQQ